MPAFRLSFPGLVLALAVSALPLHAAPPASAQDTLKLRLDADALGRHPREPVEGTSHGRTLRCEGVALATLLRDAGALPPEPLRGRHLARRVEIAARDGYQVVFALAELDPTLGPTRAYVVDRCDGRPLDADDGPLRLMVPTDARAARWIRQIDTIDVTPPR